MSTFVWIPASPTIHCLYAAKGPRSTLEKGTDYGTSDAHEAMQFETREECQEWCDKWNAAQEAEGYSGMFQPEQHGFFEYDDLGGHLSA